MWRNWCNRRQPVTFLFWHALYIRLSTRLNRLLSKFMVLWLSSGMKSRDAISSNWMVFACLKERDVLMPLSQAPYGFPTLNNCNHKDFPGNEASVKRNLASVHTNHRFDSSCSNNWKCFQSSLSYWTLPVTKKPLHYLLPL